MIEINGKQYPMWSQFVERKDEFIGGKLVDYGDPMDRLITGLEKVETVITDVILKANGKESAWFEIHGEEFSCGGDVRNLGVDGSMIVSGNGIIPFKGYGGHQFTIQRRQ